MTGCLSCCDGAEYRLPPLVRWNVRHTLGIPADDFDVQFVYDSGMEKMLEDAVSFRGSWQGKTVFSGVVDEYEIKTDSGGQLVRVTGRGMAARLLDNESEPVQYVTCTLEDILNNHVRPYGITDIEVGCAGSAAGYTVESGSSQWTALYNFCKYVCGITPRFSRSGTLVLAPESGNMVQIDASSGADEVVFNERRYGVVSSVLVRHTADCSQETVEDAQGRSRGICCRRVVTVPRAPGYDAVRYTGRYQISESKTDSVTCSLTLPEPFAAFPGDGAKLLLPAGCTGRNWLVSETESWADGDSCGTRLTMRRR